MITLIALLLLTGCRIPTYPKYIELEKDLVIEWVEDYGSFGKEKVQYNLPKGTKIYYEE